MNELAQRILAERPSDGTLSVFFCGQAGAVIKRPDGFTVAVDLYLSDCCERYFGFKRLMPHLLAASELELDLVLATHAHYDHFDPDSIPSLLAPSKTRLVAAHDCETECKRLNIPEEKITYLSVGDTFNCDDFSVKAFACDHGELAPDALGLIVRTGGKCIYFVGDTCMRRDIAAVAASESPDLMFVPINGAFGNLNGNEAAEFVSIVKPRLAVPCHYWNFAEHGGNPNAFAAAMKQTAPDISYRLCAMGECVRI